MFSSISMFLGPIICCHWSLSLPHVLGSLFKLKHKPKSHYVFVALEMLEVDKFASNGELARQK